MKNLIYSLLIIAPMVGCEMSGLQLEEAKKKKGFEFEQSKEEQDFRRDVYTIAEVFSLNTIRGEMAAIHRGFEPQLGVEERLELLDLYARYASTKMNMTVSAVKPVRPGRPIPMPTCPPRPLSDCFAPDIFLSKLELLVYCENPTGLQAAITTREGEMATLRNVSYNDEYREATLTFEVVNEELLQLPSVVTVSTVANGSEITVNAEIAGDTFQ